jgi:hypothetical protein
MVTGKCLYLVSSSASRDYVLGCVESLALPRGTIQHFRYLHPYIDERLRDSLPSETGTLPSRLRHLPVVVLYLYQVQTGGRWQAGETLNPEGQYLPLRCGQLIHAFSDGEVAHFYFEVGDYVKIRKRGDSARALLSKKRIRFRTSSSKNAYPSFAHLGIDLHLAAPRTTDALAFQKFVYKCYQPGEWRTRSLGSAPLDVTYDIIFVRVAGFFRERNERLTELTPVRRSLQGNIFAEYVLEAGATYHIKIATHLSARTPAQLAGQGTAQLKLNYDPAVIRPLGPTSFRISSQYDLEYWSFVVNSTSNQRSALTVACDHEVAIDRENFVRREVLCPEVSLPISIVAPDLEKRRGS